MKAFTKGATLIGFISLLYPFTQVLGAIDVVVNVETQNSPTTSVAGALNQLCPKLIADESQDKAGTAELRAFCNALDTATPEQKAAAYEALSAHMASSQTTLMMHGPQSMPVEVVDKRLDALRKAAKNATNARFEWDMNGQTLITGLQNDTGGGASADPQQGSRLSGFATALYTSTEQTETTTLAGFKGKTYGAVFGADYRFLDNAFAGAALRYAQSDFDLSANGGSLDASDLNLTFYGTYYPLTQWYLDWTLHYGQGQFDLSRRIDFTVGSLTVNEVADSSTDGSQYGASVGTGYEWVLKGGALAQINATFRYNQAKSDTYNETSAGGYNLRVEGQSVDTMLGKLGAQGSKAFGFKWGVLIPQINVNYIYEFIDDGEDINATFVSDPFNTQFVFTTEKRDTSYFTTAIGVVTLLPGGFTAYLQYDTYLQMDNYKQSVWSLGARMEF
jgi:uncharacterized protein YhjY with autotransporter beta-barrel domain